MRESEVEKYFVQQVRKAGGWAEKHTSPGYKGPPDRDVLWPFGITDWVELKTGYGQVKPHQKRDHKRRRALGHSVWILRSKEEVDCYIRWVLTRQANRDSAP